MGASKIIGDVQTYERASKHMGVSKYMRDPNKWGHLNIWASKIIGGVQTYWGTSKHGASKYMGHLNVWGCMDAP